MFAARIAALRLDIQRDADDLARLERKLQHIRNRQEALRVAKNALKWDEDPRVVDELMEWGWKDRRVAGLIKRVSGVVSVVAAEGEDCGEEDEEDGGVEEEEVDEGETSGEK
ncbi:hypothetical protein SLS60_002894 [Paraconiothyrium brasiliense]|uniref:Uncharacterized protein n=1 Tax=Paraconiothyrium brasiliense TaxID=300254 RepID=A0ABR3RU67_9PLEO